MPIRSWDPHSSDLTNGMNYSNTYMYCRDWWRYDVVMLLVLPNLNLSGMEKTERRDEL